MAAATAAGRLFPLALGNLGLIPFILLSPLFEAAGLAAYSVYGAGKALPFFEARFAGLPQVSNCWLV